MVPEHLIHHMQSAVEAAQTSHHPHSKVGAALVCGDYVFSHPNFWPPAIEAQLGKIDKIGNASATVHAETACLILANHKTEGGEIFSTDPSCPNCAKNMAEAGIRHLYIDHKGFEKYYAKKRLEDFKNLTLPICKTAGMSVSKIFRKEKRMEEILSPIPHKPPLEPAPQKNSAPHPPFVLCKIKNGKKSGKELKTFAGPMLNLQWPKTVESKYNFEMQPLNRLLMHAAREGLTLDLKTLTSSRVPTARELVNAVSAGTTQLSIIDRSEIRDADSLVALEFLEKEGILKLR